MEQGEDESINDFESRVRAKAQTYEFGQTCKMCKCPCTMCKSNREEDEIRTEILCNMKDKEIQRELWREDKAVNSLENVLRILWAGEATHQQLSALSNQAVAGVHPGKKCFECGKAGHLLANCPTVSKPNPARSDQCGFCGGLRKCRAKFCKALNKRCSNAQVQAIQTL